MKKTTKTISILLAALMLAACGAEATPTMSVADVQSTAVSAAFTIVAQTQAAIPTATPLPPTETPTQTPLPTNTPASLPTLAVTLTNTPASSGGDYCATRVLGSPLGRATRILIDNTTRVAVQVSLYLNETDSHNECGYRGYNIGRNGTVLITDLVQGCYNIWAWSTDNSNSFQSSGYGCINNPDKWTFQINEDTVKFVGP
ncbi:MAG TPA: hypothetical protein VMJ90_00820 [Anaerolineales bacterium]|nr:hypothetical protein [Anaerolineales bacterium]